MGSKLRWYWWVIGSGMLAIVLGAIWYWLQPHELSCEEAGACDQSEGNQVGSDARQPGDVDDSLNRPSGWLFSGSAWESVGVVPDCLDSLELKAPVDLSIVTSILYPGQERGGDYKAHGGFRFADGTNGDVTVTAPLDAELVEGSRYIEGGETQYMFEFIHPCGIAYRFDHLLTLTLKFQAIAETLPPAKVDDSRTTRLDPAPVTVDERIATAVGVATTGNTFVDFGVYDRRSKNVASQDAAWATSHNPQLAHYGICWFDFLSAADEATVRALPAGDATSGTASDYCR